MKSFKPTPTCINRASEFSHTIVELFADKNMIIYKNQSSMNVWLQNSVTQGRKQHVSITACAPACAAASVTA